MRPATRMMMMSSRGRSGEDRRGEDRRDEDRRGEERSSNRPSSRRGMPESDRYDRYERSARYDREYDRAEMGGDMERENWPRSERQRDRYGRYKSPRSEWRSKYDDDDDDDDEEGGGKYAGKFRHRENSREHEADQDVKFDELKAKHWVQGMKSSDGSTGEHYKHEQTEQMRNVHCPQCDKMEFWATMNMMYSDYCEVAKKMNVDKPEFYACMAKAFLMDEDAGEDKLAKYMRYVAGK